MMKKYLKKAKPIQSFFSFSYFGSMLLIASLIIISSCKDDDIVIASIQFTQAAFAVAENGDDLVVTLNLSESTQAGGTIEISFDGGTYGTDYTTTPNNSGNPVSLDVASGSKTASFTFSPVNNDNYSRGYRGYSNNYGC